MKAVIPTGGRGTRMQPLTYSTNKHFIPIANKPLIFYPLETVANAGIKEIAITYNPGWLDTVQKHLGDGSQWGLTITYVLQKEPKGLANIFQVCEDYIKDDSFVMHLGDNIFTEGIDKQIAHFEKEKPDGLVTMVHHPENKRMGVPYFDESGRLIKYVEKPENPPHDFAIPGLYFFTAKVFECFRGKDAIKPSARGEYEIDAPYQWLIDHGYRVDVVEYEGKWLDPGKFNDWIMANQYLIDTKSLGQVDSELVDTKVENRITVGTDCEILHSEIRGPVIIGNNVVIKNSYIGPFTAVSDGCIIEDSHIENSVVMNQVKILQIKQPIDESLIGSQSEIINDDRPGKWLKLFVGEKSHIKL